MISTVIQHDLNDSAIFDLVGMHFGEPINVGPSDGSVLATGDRFISKPEVRERLAAEAHLVDMEGYAVARAARAAGVPVTLVKQVSDEAGEQAAKSWTETLDECSAALGAWVHAHLL